MNDRLKKDRAETDRLKQRALDLGLDVPYNQNWWWEDVDNFGGSLQEWEFVRDDYTYLTDIGKAGYRKLIKDELRKEEEWKQKNLDRKIKITVSIITALTGLLGTLIGLFAILKR